MVPAEILGLVTFKFFSVGISIPLLVSVEIPQIKSKAVLTEKLILHRSQPIIEDLN